MGAWSLVSEDLAGNVRAFLEAGPLAWTRRWCGNAELAFSLPVDDANAGELLVGERMIRAYQDGILRFRGRISTPLVRTQETITVRAVDPWGDLHGRNLQARATYRAEDAGAIAWALIADQEARHTVRIAEGSIEASVPRTINYDAGKSVADAIAELSAMDSGFGFVLDPIEGAPAIASLRIVYPNAGATRDAVRFEYGDGTLANLSAFAEELALPQNAIHGTGAPDAAGSRPEATATDATSIASYDLWDAELALNDVTDLGVVQARTNGALRSDPIATYSVTPTSEAPLLGLDFDAGDLVELTIRRGAVDVSGSVRVAEAVLQVDGDGVELLSSLTLTDPNVQRVPRAPDSRLYDLLGSYARRLAVLERAPFAGV